MTNTSPGLLCFPEDVIQGSEVTIIFLFLKIGVNNLPPPIVQRFLDHGPLERDNILDVLLAGKNVLQATVSIIFNVSFQQ